MNKWKIPDEDDRFFAEEDANGLGVYRWESDDYYLGQLDYGVFQGIGMRRCKNGDTRFGVFCNDDYSYPNILLIPDEKEPTIQILFEKDENGIENFLEIYLNDGSWRFAQYDGDNLHGMTVNYCIEGYDKPRGSVHLRKFYKDNLVSGVWSKQTINFDESMGFDAELNVSEINDFDDFRYYQEVDAEEEDQAMDVYDDSYSHDDGEKGVGVRSVYDDDDLMPIKDCIGQFINGTRSTPGCRHGWVIERESFDDDFALKYYEYDEPKYMMYFRYNVHFMIKNIADEDGLTITYDYLYKSIRFSKTCDDDLTNHGKGLLIDLEEKDVEFVKYVYGGVDETFGTLSFDSKANALASGICREDGDLLSDKKTAPSKSVNATKSKTITPHDIADYWVSVLDEPPVWKINVLNGKKPIPIKCSISDSNFVSTVNKASGEKYFHFYMYTGDKEWGIFGEYDDDKESYIYHFFKDGKLKYNISFQADECSCAFEVINGYRCEVYSGMYKVGKPSYGMFTLTNDPNRVIYRFSIDSALVPDLQTIASPITFEKVGTVIFFNNCYPLFKDIFEKAYNFEPDNVKKGESSEGIMKSMIDAVGEDFW